MPKQSLKGFSSVFPMDLVTFELSEFVKDGSYTKEIVDGLKAAGFDAIHIKPLSARDRDEYESAFIGAQDDVSRMSNFRARLLAKCWVDDDGTPFGGPDIIGEVRADALIPIFERAKKLNGFDDDKAVEEAGKG